MVRPEVVLQQPRVVLTCFCRCISRAHNLLSFVELLSKETSSRKLIQDQEIDPYWRKGQKGESDHCLTLFVSNDV
jgi:hypothetical protein